MKVGELIKKLKEFPMDAELITYKSDIEKFGMQKAYFNPKFGRYSIEEKFSWDRFDGTDYTYNVYVKDENGEFECVEM